MHAPLKTIIGRDYLQEVDRFKSEFLEYIKNPEGTRADEIITLAQEVGMDLWPEAREKGDRSYYEMLLNGKKDEKHYFFIASDIFNWGRKADAIDYLKIGISHLPANQTFELLRLKNEFENLPFYIGTSENLMKRILKAAKTDMDILIQGETGTGKELVAHLIHDLSVRRNEPFRATSCAEFSPELMRSELFGHEKGAFTGAIRKETGILKDAQNGTVFLDEINTLEPFLQAKLLRCLQERKIRPVGATKPIEFKARVLCATNQSALELVDKEKMRGDLYYRIATFKISLPPLRVRVHLIPDLALHFIKKYKSDNQKWITLSEPAMKFLKNYSWPGNARQLENLLRAVVTTMDGNKITLSQITEFLNSENKGFQLVQEATNEKKWWTKKELIERYQDMVLEEHNGNIPKASKILGVAASTLRRRRSKTH